MELEDGTMIPFHRVTEILENSVSIWRREVITGP
jgi:uncharacterized protein (UPF0248 family)